MPSDTPPASREDIFAAGQATLSLLNARAPEATVCPSEVARAVAGAEASPHESWRLAMPTIHAAVDELMAEGLIRLSWKGRRLVDRKGPYRIGRADDT